MKIARDRRHPSEPSMRRMCDRVRFERRWANLCDAGRRGPFLPGGRTGHQRELDRRDPPSPRHFRLRRNQGSPSMP
jgi:hypothetical protein